MLRCRGGGGAGKRRGRLATHVGRRVELAEGGAQGGGEGGGARLGLRLLNLFERRRAVGVEVGGLKREVNIAHFQDLMKVKPP